MPPSVSFRYTPRIGVLQSGIERTYTARCRANSLRRLRLSALISTTVIPRQADRVVILINPKAGARTVHPRAECLAQRLRAQGLQAELLTDLSAATSLANQWHTEGRLRALVGAGGDGTAAELVNRTAEGVPITLLPGGNSNLLARQFHISREPEALCRMLVEGAMAQIDAGSANGRVFLVMVSCGFDADVVRRVHGRRTAHVTDFSYVKPIAEAIWNYDFPEIRVHCEEDGADVSPLSVRWLFVCNLPRYGGGFRVAPQADGADGLLDMCAFRGGHLWRGLGYVAALLLRRHHRLTDCTTRRVRQLRVTSDAPVPYQLDGDPGGLLPLDVRVLPGRLTLIVPREAVESG
jgi:diacylglycerol kinase (ATP)